MQFATISLATLTAIAASVVSAESAPFGIMNTRSGTQFHYTSWGSDSKGNVVIQSLSKDSTEFSSLHVEDDTSVKTSDGKYFVVNSDHSITLGDASAATKGFTIGAKEGALIPFNFNGQDGYVTCPNSAGDYVLYTENPANYNDKCSGLSSWAVGDDGDVAVFPGDSSASPSTSVAPTLNSKPLFAPTGYLNTSSTVVTSDVSTTVITITSCADNKCTLYTTTCPITDVPTTTPVPSNAEVPTTNPDSTVVTTDVATTVVTITSCAEDKCRVYTTTCPITAIPTSTPIASNAEVQATTTLSSVTASEGAASTTPSVAALTGGANVELASSFAAFGALAFALIM